MSDRGHFVYTRRPSVYRDPDLEKPWAICFFGRFADSREVDVIVCCDSHAEAIWYATAEARLGRSPTADDEMPRWPGTSR